MKWLFIVSLYHIIILYPIDIAIIYIVIHIAIDIDIANILDPIDIYSISISYYLSYYIPLYIARR